MPHLPPGAVQKGLSSRWDKYVGMTAAMTQVPHGYGGYGSHSAFVSFRSVCEIKHLIIWKLLIFSLSLDL